MHDILRPVRAPSLDFGGSEFNPAGMETMQAIKQNKEDNYGWWNLQRGFYQAYFNELISLTTGMIALISLHEHAIQAGILGNSSVLTSRKSSVRLNFHVPDCGCNLKENARLATAVLMGEV